MSVADDNLTCPQPAYIKYALLYVFLYSASTPDTAISVTIYLASVNN